MRLFGYHEGRYLRPKMRDSSVQVLDFRFSMDCW